MHLEAFEHARYRRASLYELSEWYDVDYAGYKAEEPFYKMLVTQHVPRDGAYVELGAGTGRLLLAVARTGARAHGVEPARGMARRCVAKLKDARLPRGLCTLERKDGSTFEGPKDAVPWVISFPFNGLLHVHSHEELLGIFTRCREKLHPEGRIALDITSPAWEEMALGGRPWGRVDERIHPETGERVLTCDRCEYDEATRVCSTWFRFLLEGERSGVELSIHQFMWTYQEVLHALERAGFVVDMVFGDVDFAPLVEKSPRLLVAAAPRR